MYQMYGGQGSGFIKSAITDGGYIANNIPSTPIYRGMTDPGAFLTPELKEQADLLQRGEFTGDINNLYSAMMQQYENFTRTITSTMTGFPVRENLEAPARLLVPLDTPFRNRTKRVPGSGTASAWRQITSLGGGYGVNTTVNGAASNATQTLVSTAGMQAGDVIFFATTNASRIVSSVTNTTVVVLTATISTTNGEVVTRVGQPGTGTGAIRAFFAETGAPAARSTVYASKSATYKLLGSYADITVFSMAAGNTWN